MFRNRKAILLLSMMLILSLGLMGCGGAAENDGKGTVRIVYVEWACANASAHVVADVLENKMGYKVELTSVAAPLMFEALANGDADAMTTAWLPVTHESYMKSVEGKVENLGPNAQGAKLALTVPDYVTINSIEELNAHKDKFNGEIIGIDPGAGIMKLTEKAIVDYNLDFELVEGGDATMVAALKSAIDKQNWVAVTGWIPHWKFSRYDLKTLEDPKKVLGEDENIETVVRLGLKEDLPEVYEFFQNFKWSVDDLQNAMLMALEGDMTPKEAASKWVEENPELVNSWLPENYKE
ncbi:MAG: glycine betaine ABC transporter substrate-binding protein [Syntrophomonadaceae bacterium]|nr:glycine betaine ABC transporter substrate-binding protein [Syntrophomonadaceae bacterium]